MANKVAIVTDSTAYIPDEWKHLYGVKVCPSIVIFGEEQFRDSVDMKSEDFFVRLASSDVMPTTAQPTPADFKAVYDPLIADGYDILGVHISHKLSGTFASAESARQMMEGANIENVDTLSASMGEGWPILMAARAAQEGKTLAECKAIAEEASKHTYVALAVDTLEFLHRGGRIGGAQRFLGTALNMKPLLEIADGMIEPLERVRTRKKSLNRLAEVVTEKVQGKSPVYLGALHANALEDAQYVVKLIKSMVEVKDTVVTPVSAAVGTHTGPGTVGIAVMAGYS